MRDNGDLMSLFDCLWKYRNFDSRIVVVLATDHQVVQF